MQICPSLGQRLEPNLAIPYFKSRILPFRAKASPVACRAHRHQYYNLAQAHIWFRLARSHAFQQLQCVESRSTPRSLPEGPGEGSFTTVKDTQILGGAQVNGSAPHSNGRSNGNAGAISASSNDSVAPAGAQHAESPEPPGKADTASAGDGLPHRWRIVFMMAVAFVLCNMDKVMIFTAACLACTVREDDGAQQWNAHKQLWP